MKDSGEVKLFPANKELSAFVDEITELSKKLSRYNWNKDKTISWKTLHIHICGKYKMSMGELKFLMQMANHRGLLKTSKYGVKLKG